MMSGEIHRCDRTRSGVTRSLSVASMGGGAQPSLPSALASFLAEEAHATRRSVRRCWQATRSSSCSMPIPPRRLRCSARCG